MEFLINLSYIVASVLFILGIKMLGSAVTARKGNLISSVGMLLAVVVTLLDSGLDYTWIGAGLLIGSAIGVIWAKRVQMTGMPELVALLNGFGGLGSLLVGWAEFAREQDFGSSDYPLFTAFAVIFAILVGGITFTGSLVAYLKLSGKMSGSALTFSGQKAINAVVFLAIIVVGGFFVATHAVWALYVIIFLSLALGILAVIPIGGGDMPVVISFLNSFSGIAASAAGFVIFNNVLIVAGCLVGASGIILTVIMCKAMNRTLGNVLFGSFGAGSGKSAAVEGEMKAISTQDAFYILEAAQSVVFVPGYGMAVAQAQHAVKELGALLENNGAEVRYAIHPVAGRMPGHMNVLLAEADVPYEQLCEMDDINAIIESVDVAIIIGANDVVNPAAAEDEGSPIYGMPIINAYKARTVFALKRGKGAGFSGLENSLFFRDNTRMIYGDAKETMTALVAQFKS
ncbi:MAG: NAD(P)(+) transhydrogenase (Re/Si-specific) subunit beta [Verrucomicrobiales bacterium]|jgi:NAD(P) transhydrogenase subunit beta|nr:NAD(P)(+) transhydrogenase (Re/Si-specific) subunit beta [Verrucomicrobiales bacterium]MBP9224355.1 NAD(P)(+) transhydrogenase (Re/Si-specific) subunit beta [Verrucomicrobiales bacterium]HQZ27940.1 NAD(P)(+) transhydrogenase (Re/Si-specific) subunit beta [Verrucomicrobiales bacterium]